MLTGGRGQIITVAHDQSRAKQHSEAEGQQANGSFTGPFPFVKPNSPERAEDYDARHVNTPTRKCERTHFRVTHRVKEKLQIPGHSGNGTKHIVFEKWDLHCFADRSSGRVDENTRGRTRKSSLLDRLRAAGV